MTNKVRKLWLNEKFEELRQDFGNKCLLCNNSHALEFAHINSTKLSGSSRGKQKRYYDIKNNKECYALLCKKCHRKADNDSKVMKEVKRKRF